MGLPNWAAPAAAAVIAPYAAGAAATAAIGTGAYNIYANERARHDQATQNRQQRAYELEDRDWSESMTREMWAREDNAVQRRAADLIKAGLHPALAAGSPADAGATISSPQGTKTGKAADIRGVSPPDLSSLIRSPEMLANIDLMNKQVEKLESDISNNNDLTSADIALKGTSAGLNKAETAKAYEDVIDRRRDRQLNEALGLRHGETQDSWALRIRALINELNRAGDVTRARQAEAALNRASQGVSETPQGVAKNVDGRIIYLQKDGSAIEYRDGKKVFLNKASYQTWSEFLKTTKTK